MWELYTQSDDVVATTIFYTNSSHWWLPQVNGTVVNKVLKWSVEGCYWLPKLQHQALLWGFAERLFAGRLEGRMLFLPLLLKTDIFLRSARRDGSHHLHWKNLQVLRKKHIKENSPSSLCTVFRGHLPQRHRIMWRACLGAPAAVTNGAR